VAGKAAIGALAVVAMGCAATLVRHVTVRGRAQAALVGMPESPVAVLPDGKAYGYPLPGGPGAVPMNARERQALIAHERAHLAGRHHRYLLVAELVARANLLLYALRGGVAYCAERWADEEAAGVVGDRRVMARVVGKAALVSRGTPAPTPAGFAAPGPVPRRVAALLGPVPPARRWPPAATAAGLAAWIAAVGTAASALSSANATVALFLVLQAATPL
jgi:hypothetical protein